MIKKIEPFVLKGDFNVPVSKSICHRSLICGALSEKSVIYDTFSCDDLEATLNSLSSLGAFVKRGSSLEIGGLTPEKVPENVRLNARESGSTLRFLIPFCLMCDKNIFFEGSARLFERPLDFYEKIAAENGFVFERGKNALRVKGNLRAGRYTADAAKTSQFVTGMLLALPLAEGDSTIEYGAGACSAPYIDLTVKVMEDFGIPLEREKNTVFVKGSRQYKSIGTSIEGDYSCAAYLEAYNLAGGDVKIKNLNEKSLQGDKIYKELFYNIKNSKASIDLASCPDLAPILFACSALYSGGEFYNTDRLKYKESDRISASSVELAKFGIEMRDFGNKVTVYPAKPKKPTEILDCKNDHRIAMALTFLCSITGGEIEGCECVSKSFPNYFEVIK